MGVSRHWLNSSVLQLAQALDPVEPHFSEGPSSLTPSRHLVGICLPAVKHRDRDGVSGDRGQATEALTIDAVLLEQKLWARKAIWLRNDQDYASNPAEHLHGSACLL